MIFHRWGSGYASATYVVELEGKEVDLSDNCLITMADNSQTTFPTPEQIAGWNGPGRGPRECHFGGRVERAPGKVDKSKTYARVVVYID